MQGGAYQCFSLDLCVFCYLYLLGYCVACFDGAGACFLLLLTLSIVAQLAASRVMMMAINALVWKENFFIVMDFKEVLNKITEPSEADRQVQNKNEGKAKKLFAQF
jgi:hypothetical protein